MKRTVAVLALVGVAGLTSATSAIASGVSFWGHKIGSGHVVAEERTVGEFTSIEANSMLDVNIRVGAEPSLVIHLDDNLLPLITTKIEDGRLIIENKKNWKSEAGGRVEITVPSLELVESNGVGDITIQGLSAESFELEQNGTGDVELSGSLAELDITLDGMGDVDAQDVEAKFVHVDVRGMGDVHVHATDDLRGNVSGMGDVFSHGKPEHVSLNVSGMGSLIER